MNAPALNLLPSLPREQFAAATERVNAWRGRCIDAFTRAEGAVNECLVAMAAVEGRGQRVALPHLLGQRLEALAEALTENGPFAGDGMPAVETLKAFRGHAGLRNMLCHGETKVTLDLQGRWTVVLRLVTFQSSRISREKLALTEAEAEELRSEVDRLSRNLSSQLGQLRARLR